MTNAIVCDDHAAIRSGLKAILNEAGIEVSALCKDMQELRDAVKARPGSVVVSDLAIDGTQVGEAISEIMALDRTCRVVVYSMRNAAATIAVCYSSGASAFIPKSADPDELIAAIKEASLGKNYFPPQIASELANLHVDPNNPSVLLSPREMTIFVGFVECGTVDALAGKLGISDRSVQNVLWKIASKLNTPRSNFHNLAKKYGLIQDS